MQERLKELPKKFLEYWNKWTSKQKTIVVSAVSGVILLIGILIFVLGRTKYVDLYTYPDTKTASQVVTLLQGNSITTKLASDNLTVKVDDIPKQLWQFLQANWQIQALVSLGCWIQALQQQTENACRDSIFTLKKIY